MKNDAILITGASGAIGGAIKDTANEFHGKSFLFASSQDCDLIDESATKAFINKMAPKAIIHLAARAGGVGLNKSHPATLLRDNTKMSLNVLEAAREASVEKIIMTLSSGIYPKTAPLPLSEKDLHNGYPDESNYGYAFAKRLIDPMIKAYRAEYGMHIIGLMPNNVVGEHSSFRTEDSGVVPALVRRFYENRDGTNELTVWGDGSPLREISYAKDIARIFMWCLDNYDEPQILNIGTGEELSIRGIAYTVADVFGIASERIVFDSTKPSGPKHKSTDTTRLQSLHSFAYTPAHETIAIVARYFAEHYNDGTLRL